MVERWWGEEIELVMVVGKTEINMLVWGRVLRVLPGLLLVVGGMRWRLLGLRTVVANDRAGQKCHSRGGSGGGFGSEQGGWRSVVVVVKGFRN